MPLECPPEKDFPPRDNSVGAAYLAESRQTLHSAHRKIVHCLNQLSDDDVQWRPFEEANSIQNIILHLCGNIRQWIMHGAGGAEDVRDRPREFSDHQPLDKQELSVRLSQTLQEADDVLARFDPARLTEPRTVQGFDSNLLSVIYETVSHFVGHTHQIVYISRLRLGNRYRFQWVPEGIDSAQLGDTTD